VERVRPGPIASFLFAACASVACSTSKSSPPPSASPDDAGGGAADSAAPPAQDAGPTFDFSALSAQLFRGQWKSGGVVVMVNGQMVFEKYAAGFDEKKRPITYSVSKTIGSALVGIAIGDGLMKLADSVCKYVPAPTGADPTYCDTTVENVLQMTSGL